jgi:hypothetical protein
VHSWLPQDRLGLSVRPSTLKCVLKLCRLVQLRLHMNEGW